MLDEWWQRGFEARIVVVREGAVPHAVLGRTLVPALADELERIGVDACGENGEFHTLATNGPVFRNPISLRLGEQVKREDCWALDLSIVQ